MSKSLIFKKIVWMGIKKYRSQSWLEGRLYIHGLKGYMVRKKSRQQENVLETVKLFSRWPILNLPGVRVSK